MSSQTPNLSHTMKPADRPVCSLEWCLLWRASSSALRAWALCSPEPDPSSCSLGGLPCPSGSSSPPVGSSLGLRAAAAPRSWDGLIFAGSLQKNSWLCHRKKGLWHFHLLWQRPVYLDHEYLPNSLEFHSSTFYLSLTPELDWDIVTDLTVKY